MGKKIVLIDGHSILNRAFYGLPDLTNSEGLHTNAVYGFLNILFKILEEEKPDYLTVAFDLHAPTFRHRMYEAYKGTRKPMPEELRQQVPLMKEVLFAMGIEIVQQEGYEADDLLGTLAKRCEQEGMDVTIVSGDRDLLQLATEHTKIRIPKTKGGRTLIEDYYTKDVIEKYQVEPWQIVELKALMGDTADNIPGIPGVGEKTATKMIVQFGTVENAYAHLEEVKPNKARESLRENYDKAVLSRKLAAINVDSPVEYSLKDAEVGDFYTDAAYEMFRRLEFKNLLSRFSDTPAGEPFEPEIVTELLTAEDIFSQAKGQLTIGAAFLESGKKLLGAALSWGEKHVYFPAEGFVTEAYLEQRLNELAESVTVCSMDIKGLLKWAPQLNPERAFDASIAAYLLNPLKSAYHYEDIAKEFAGRLLPSPEDIFKAPKLPAPEKMEQEQAAQYLCAAACAARASCDEMLRRLDETGMRKLFDEIELPLAFTLHDMEQAGIRVEGEALKAYGEQLEVRIRELERIIHAQAGEEFNISSPKQLGVILFEKLGLPGGKKTKSGYSTAADVLDKLAPDHEIVANVLEYRQLTKLKSTYADGLAVYIGEDGRIHSNFNQTITATGRISSTEPNLQNIPIRMELGRLIRKVFVPEDGYVFLDADYSQIELRVLAHLSGDEKLIEAYREARDIHRITAAEVFHVPFDEVTPLQRRNAKAVNFGIVYGISSFGLSQDLSITRKEAAEYIEKYFETYPKIKGFLDGCVAQAKEKGYAVTLFGRRRPVPELSSSNFMQRSFGERVAMNSPIQGTAADIIKIAMIRVNDRLKSEGFSSRLVLQVHDELLIETKREETAQVAAILEEEMKNAAHLKVNLEVDMEEGENWYEAK